MRETSAFGLGPRLNAAGRLKEALAAFELLTTKDVTKAGELAQQLDMQNRERQRITRDMQTRAEEIAIGDDPNAYLLFAADENFNSGVVGLAASRLTEKYYRPAIVASKGEEETRGSCRSIPEFHITDALDQCADLLVRHGGHAAAAGFTVTSPTWNQPVMAIPTRFLSQGMSRSGRRAQSVRRAGILNCPSKIHAARPTTPSDFRLGGLQASLPPRVDVMFTLEANEWNGRTTLQLNLKDVKEAGIPD
jgi:single-stranded-DNA-specific exonuclease